MTSAGPLLAVVCAATALCVSAQTPQSATDSKEPASKAVSKSAASKRQASKPTKKAAPPPRPPAQQHPTIDRYKEIQQALMDRGYFSGPVDGNWGPESESALQRFQHDQNLDGDGKISSLSLIALGLGPRRTVPEPPKPPPEQETK